MKPSNKSPQTKSSLHPRNRNRERYDLSAMIETTPELAQFVRPNHDGQDTVDFSQPEAVKLLNKAILANDYGIANWEFPDDYLCPPIPGRADYLHHMADRLGKSNSGKIPKGKKVTCLDVGVGASCIYPIIGIIEYGWRFIGSDIHAQSIESAQRIVGSNPSLKGKVDFRLQNDVNQIFRDIIRDQDLIDLTICNPPFHSSVEEALKGTRRKVMNLSGKKKKTPPRNFSGAHNELVYEGGEVQFIQNMINESAEFPHQVFWFSTLVSKHDHLKSVYRALDDVNASEVQTIQLGTGNKTSRIVAWTFLSDKQQKAWREMRWS